MNRADFLLGIDLGTTTCRAAVFDLSGEEVAAAYAETPVSYPRPLWAEVDPRVWWDGVAEVVRRVLHDVPAERIAGVGLSGLMHAPVLLDEVGEPVVPAMLWMDQRCAAQCGAIVEELRAAGKTPAREVSSTFSAPKLRWLADERPEALARAARLMLPKDYVRFRLCGVDGSDTGDAGGTGLFDRQSGAWLWDLVDACRVPRGLLPALREPWARAGGVSEAAARATGLREGTAVAVGSADTYCTRLGAGRLAPGEACVYLGTAAWIAMTDPATGTARGFGSTSSTGSALRWTRDLIGPWASEALPADVSGSYARLTAQAEEVAPGAEGLFFLPHLMGERGPVSDPLARGALVGLTLRHGRGHVTRAVMEGTAFQLRRVIEARVAEGRAAAPSGGIACGGAARSALWMQLLADVTRVPLRVPAVVEAGALGAAILGGVAAGVLASPEEAQARMIGTGASYAPDEQGAAQYDALYARYCRLDDLLAPWFREA
ncbi:MAG TPA: FGGY family carbohydrate kinase [Chloroflexota bacterium]|nr:FGGY family carbohydrate kinase [Chloroflexota bacterium]